MRKITIFLFILIFFNINITSAADYKEKCIDYTTFFKNNNIVNDYFKYENEESLSQDFKEIYKKQLEERARLLLNNANAIVPLFTKENIVSECGDILDITNNNSVVNLDREKRYKYTYCTLGVILNNNKDEYKTEDDIFEEGKDEKTMDVAYCASAIDRLVLTHKSQILEKETKKSLGSDDKGDLLELRSGLDCFGLKKPNSEIKGCIIDPRLKKQELTIKNTGYFSSMSIGMSMYSVYIGNWFLTTLNSIVTQSSVGYMNIDSLPIFPYSMKDMFTQDNIYGFINKLIIPFYGFVLFFVFFKKGVGGVVNSRDGFKETEDSFKVILIKIFVILFFTLGFSLFYNSLKLLMENMGTTLQNSVSDFLGTNVSGIKANKDIVLSSLKFEVFSSDGGTFLSGFAIFSIINPFLLLGLTLFYYIREIFIQFLGIIFSISAVSLILGSSRIPLGSSITKAGKYLTNLLYYSISFFITIVIMVFIIKILTIILMMIPSFDDPSIGFIDSLPMLGISCFIYLCAIYFIIIKSFKKILPSITAMVGNLLQKLFFDGEKYIGVDKIISDISNQTQEFKKGFDDIGENKYVKQFTDGAGVLKKTKAYEKLDEYVLNKNSTIRKSLDSKWGKRLINTGKVTGAFVTKMSVGADLSKEKENIKKGLLSFAGFSKDDNKTRAKKLKEEIQQLEKQILSGDGNEKYLSKKIHKLKEKNNDNFKNIVLPEKQKELFSVIQELHNSTTNKQKEELLNKFEEINKSISEDLNFYKDNEYNKELNELLSEIKNLEENKDQFIKDITLEGYEQLRINLENKKNNLYSKVNGNIQALNFEKNEIELQDLSKKIEKKEELLKSVEGDSKIKLFEDIENLKEKLNAKKIENKKIDSELKFFNFSTENFNEKMNKSLLDDSDNNEKLIEEIQNLMLPLPNSEEINSDYIEIKESNDFSIKDKFKELVNLNSLFINIELDAKKILKSEEFNNDDYKEEINKLLEVYNNVKFRREEITQYVKTIGENISKPDSELEKIYIKNDPEGIEREFINDLVKDNAIFYNSLLEEFSQEKIDKNTDERINNLSDDNFSLNSNILTPNKDFELNKKSQEEDKKTFWAE